MTSFEPPDRRITAFRATAAVAVVTAVSLAAVLQWRSTRHVVEAGFWFERVSLDAPMHITDLGGALHPDEMKRIESVAWSELRSAYSDLRIVFSGNRRAQYRVRVLEDFPPRPGPPGAAAESRPMGLLGGEGAISFRTIVGLAINNAPPGAPRATIIDGIGRGIGRAAAHEFAHQILFPGESLHSSTDPASYEYASANRPAQFYGPIHWDNAWPLLVRRLGRE